MNLMNVAFCAGWTGGLVSNFRCVRRSKRLHKINLSFPNAILNIPQVTYFEDRIFSEVLPYPIFYIAAKQLNEVLLSSNYFFVGNKTSY